MTPVLMTTAAALAAGIALASAAVPATPAATPSLHRVLLDAIDDEYRAEATYQAILDKFGSVRPFSNIVNAERRHANLVAGELQRHGWAVPANPYSGKIAAPATLLDACKAGVDAEVANIALYDRLLPGVTDLSAKAVLEQLQWASRANHLPAFERCVARGGAPGRGGGGGMGGGGMGRGLGGGAIINR